MPSPSIRRASHGRQVCGHDSEARAPTVVAPVDVRDDRSAPAHEREEVVPIRRFVAEHLSSRQVSRVVYGSIIGLALIVALEAHPPPPGAVTASLLGTAVAVALAELYSELVGFETIEHRKAGPSELRRLGSDIAAVAFGIGFPALFFLLSAAGSLKTETAFTVAKWTGLGLIGVYGFAGARLSGAGLPAALVHAAAVALVGAALIVLKSLVH
jgi:hypothetical protein